MDPEVEHEIESAIAGLEPFEESDAVGVLATWRQTKTAMTEEKWTRGLRPAGVVKLETRLLFADSQDRLQSLS